MMMKPGRRVAPLEHPSAWKGSELQQSDEWLTQLDPDDIAELEQALVSTHRRKLRLEEITRETFVLPRFAEKLRSIAEQIELGRGFALIRGLPVERWGEQDATRIYWGMSTHLGQPVSQNARGDRMIAVRSTGADAADVNVRGPDTNAQLFFHSDFSDVVGLMCMHPAKSGGLSRICSSIAIFNALLEAGHDDLVEAFYEGFPFDRKGEEGPGLAPVSERPIPMLSWHLDRLSFRYVPGWSRAATVRTGHPWSGVQQRAIDTVNELSNRPDFYLDMQFQKGDVQYLSNYSILHSRTAFEDHAEPERRRFLQRIWLNASLGRQLADGFDHLFGAASTRDGIPCRDRIDAI